MKLEELRREINKIDQNIVRLLGERFRVIRKIASFKRENNLLIEDQEREGEIMEKIRQLGTNIGLDAAWLKKIFRLIISESKKIQKKRI